MDVFDQIKKSNLEINGKLKYELIPKFGLCLKLMNFSLDYIRFHLMFDLHNNIEVFITDDIQKTHFGFFIESQIGDQITIEAGKRMLYSYKVKLNIFNNEQSAQEDNCNNHKNYNYSQCVDEQIFKEFDPVYGCVPNWLSLRNPCKKVIPIPENLETSYAIRYFTLQQTSAEMKCKKPCLHQVIFSIWGSKNNVLLSFYLDEA